MTGAGSESKRSQTLDSRFDDYQVRLQRLQERWMHYPMVVTVETLAVCNAACEFCPYPKLMRKGERMPEELFHKIVNELAEQASSYPQMFGLARVNEPFIDKRIFEFCDVINAKLPNTQIFFHTNASPLNQDNLRRLAEVKRVNFVKISLNAHTKEEYEQIMEIPFERTIKNVTRIHDWKEEGRIAFRVIVGRVGDGTERDNEFVSWCREKFPLFDVSVTPRGDWMGDIETEKSPVPDVGCNQWFELHILSDGREAFCCIDADGRFASGNAREQHVVNIYNSPSKLALRQSLPSRLSVPTCSRCPMLT